jgi:hypothetical protein
MGFNGPQNVVHREQSTTATIFAWVVFLGVGACIFAGFAFMQQSSFARRYQVKAKIVATSSNWMGEATTYEFEGGHRTRESGKWGSVGDQVTLTIQDGQIVGR